MKHKSISIICIILLVCSLLFLSYYHVLQPYFSEKSTDTYRELYHTAKDTSSDFEVSQTPDAEAGSATTMNEALDDAQATAALTGKFDTLRVQNKDICGWLTIPGTNIDYPVVSATKENTDYYLSHNIDGKDDKNGSLFIDYRTELTTSSKALVINGHNMKSTGLMFHELTKYNKLDFYQQNPTFTFDTIYDDGTWKIFSVFKTNNNANHGERFNYFRDEFDSDTDFLDYVYELELRSIYQCPVDINEDDSLLLLSTCTYEMDDMRLVIAARKLREAESEIVDTTLASTKSAILYPDAWYEQYGGTRPEATSFAVAYSGGEITWYDGNIFD